MVDNKALIVVRHGDYNHGDGLLSEVGKQKIDAVGNRIAKSGYRPSIIFASPATRTEQSAVRLGDVFKEVAGEEPKIKIARWLALGEQTDPRHLNIIDDSINTAMLVTHEPNALLLLACLKCVSMDFSPQMAGAYIVTADRNQSWSKMTGAMRLAHSFEPS